MSWSGAMSTLKTNLETAAAAVTPVIPTVKHGEPDALNTDLIAFWTSASRSSQTGGNTLTKVNRERGVQVTVYLRGSVRAGAIDDTLELRAAAIEDALHTALWADAGLGGNAIGIDIEAVSYGWEVIGNQLARTVSATVWIDLAEVATISL